MMIRKYIALLISTFFISFSANAQLSEAVLKRFNQNIDPSEWAECMSAYATYLALKARGGFSDKEYDEYNKNMDAYGEIFGLMRRQMLKDGYSQKMLDALIKSVGPKYMNNIEASGIRINQCTKKISQIGF